MTESTHWTEVEFAELDLGDARLDKRARKIMEQFSGRPTASIPKSCNGWGETAATYRFLDNDAVEWRDILKPHWAQTQQRMSEHPVILCIQDTSELLCAAAHNSSDAGCIVMQGQTPRSIPVAIFS